MVKDMIMFSRKDRIFFTADTHWGHRNIIRYCQRPFSDVEEMNEALITNWNSTVGKDDIVFHLGDFAMGGSAEWSRLLDHLNGKIYLILGNHDMKTIGKGFSRFEHVAMQMLINIGGQRIYLNHYPFLCFGGAYRNTWQLFGHVHSGPLSKTGKDIPRLSMLFPSQYDVGVDNNGFRPVSFNEVKVIIQKQQGI
jgi:calcineurin-like phosphoesterase family protein